MHNPFAPTQIVDRLIGNAFPVVREVHDNLPKLLYLSENVDALTEGAHHAISTSTSALAASQQMLAKADAALFQVQALEETSGAAVQQAAASASLAQGFRDSTQGLLNTFGRYWLGEHKSDPTADNQGNALIIGAFYLNTSSTPSVVRTYTTSGWQVPATPDTVLSSALAAVAQANAAAEAATATADRAMAAAAGYVLADGSRSMASLTVRGTTLCGTDQSVSLAGTVAGLQVSGVSPERGAVGSSIWSADGNGPAILLGKSRGGAVGAQGAVLSGDSLGSFRFAGSDGAGIRLGAQVSAVAAESFTASAWGTRLDFETTPKGTTAKALAMRLTDAGRLLIGTTADNGVDQVQVHGSLQATGVTTETVSSNTLHVAGAATVGGLTTAGAVEAGSVSTVGNMSCQDQTVKGTSTANSVAAKSLTSDAADIGAITARTVAASVNITLSDERLKTNWRALDADFLEKLAGVKFGVFDWLSTGESQVGVSAQSMESVLPDAVTTVGENHLAVAYGNAALAAVIALTKRVLQLEEQLRAKEPA